MELGSRAQRHRVSVSDAEPRKEIGDKGAPGEDGRETRKYSTIGRRAKNGGRGSKYADRKFNCQLKGTELSKREAKDESSFEMGLGEKKSIIFQGQTNERFR